MSEEKCAGIYSCEKYIPCDKDALYIGCDGPCCEEHKCRCAKPIQKNKSNDDQKFINNTLQKYLDDPKYKSYDDLISLVLNSKSSAAKYNLFTLFMKIRTEEFTVENLQNRLENIYCEDKSLEDYIKDIVQFNPKLNSIEITTKSRQDIKDENSLYLHIDKAKYSDNMDEYFADADKKIKRIENYLRIILTESKNLK